MTMLFNETAHFINKYNEILQISDMLYIYTSFYRQASSTLLQFGLIPLAVAFQMSSIFSEATFTS